MLWFVAFKKKTKDPTQPKYIWWYFVTIIWKVLCGLVVSVLHRSPMVVGSNLTSRFFYGRGFKPVITIFFMVVGWNLSSRFFLWSWVETCHQDFFYGLRFKPVITITFFFWSNRNIYCLIFSSRYERYCVANGQRTIPICQWSGVYFFVGENLRSRFFLWSWAVIMTSFER